MTCDMAEENSDSQDLAFQALTFLILDGSWFFLGLGTNIVEASWILFPLLVSQVLSYYKALDWLQIANTGNMFYAYVSPSLTDL